MGILLWSVMSWWGESYSVVEIPGESWVGGKSYTTTLIFFWSIWTMILIEAVSDWKFESKLTCHLTCIIHNKKCMHDKFCNIHCPFMCAILPNNFLYVTHILSLIIINMWMPVVTFLLSKCPIFNSKTGIVISAVPCTCEGRRQLWIKITTIYLDRLDVSVPYI